MIVMIVMTWQELIYRPPGDDNEKLDCDDNDDDEDVWTANLRADEIKLWLTVLIRV